MPVLAMLYNTLFFAYSLRFARKHEVYDYQSYNDAFYGRFSPIFSNLFEVLYICVMCVAPAVAFATGGATLSTLTGLPYLLCTLLIVYIPNIIAGFSGISAAVSSMTQAELPLGDALYSAFLYGTFQLSNIAVFVQHAKSFERPEDAVKSMGVGFVVNSLMMVMVVLGLMTIYTDPDAAGQSVPTLFMVQNGVGASFMTPLISILIILGAVSTAVNMVAAMVKRIYGEKDRGFRRTHYAQGDSCSAGLLPGGLWDRAVWAADIDSEGVQLFGISGNSGDSRPLYYSYGGYTV